MKTTLQNLIKSIKYVAPGPAVPVGPGVSGFMNTIKHACKCATQERLAAVNICDGYICAAYLTQVKEEQPMLQRLGWATYTFNESDESIAKKIHQLWKECEIPTHLVTTCLHSRSLSLKHFKYSGLTQPEIESALQLEAEDALQLPPDEVVMDWHLNKPNTPDQSDSSGILVSAPSRKVKQLVHTLRTAGLYPAVIDTGPTAVSNLYLSLKGSLPAGESLVILNLSDFHADICVLYEGQNLYPRSVFSQSGKWENNVNYLLENLQDALLYYHVKVCKDPIKKILITGEIFENESFLAQLKESTRLPAEIWNPLEEPAIQAAKACYLEPMANVNSSVITTCLGLALRRETEYDHV